MTFPDAVYLSCKRAVVSSILKGGSIHLSVEMYDIAGANRPSHDGGISTVEPWTSPNACDSPPSNPLAVQTITASPALHFRSVLTLREYRCRAA